MTIHFGIRVFRPQIAGHSSARFEWRPACRSQEPRRDRSTVQVSTVPSQVTCKTCQQRTVYKDAAERGVWL